MVVPERLSELPLGSQWSHQWDRLSGLSPTALGETILLFCTVTLGQPTWIESEVVRPVDIGTSANKQWIEGRILLHYRRTAQALASNLDLREHLADPYVAVEMNWDMQVVAGEIIEIDDVGNLKRYYNTGTTSIDIKSE